MHMLNNGRSYKKLKLDTRRQVLYASAWAVMVPVCYSAVTLKFDLSAPKFNSFICPIIHHWCKFVKSGLILFPYIVLASPESAVSNIPYSTVTLTF